MAQRNVTDVMLLALLAEGAVRHKDESRLWVAKSFRGRDYNLVCAAVVLEDRLIVKTVMHHFRWED